jgi:hypothetical protein
MLYSRKRARERTRNVLQRVPTKDGTRNILVVGDLHVGSTYGLLPPDFVSCDGSEKSQNEGQKYLWACWEDLKRRLARFSIDCVVVNGDVIEGRQPKQKASELTLVGPNDQEAAAVFVLRDLRNWLEKNTRRQVPFYVIQGTEYHDGRGAEELESIAARIEGANIDSALTGRHCKEVLDLNVDGVGLNFAHHVGGGSGFARSGTIDAEAVWAQLAGSKGQAQAPDLIVRSHLHFFMHIEHTHRHAFVCPCWQLQTRFARRRSAFKFMPDIGALIFHVCPDAKQQGLDPVAHTKILYKLPVPRSTKLKVGKALAKA